MGDSEPKRPSWTFGVTLDHPLAIFCPHHADHVEKKKAVATAVSVCDSVAQPAANLETPAQTSPPEEPSRPAARLPSTRGCPVMNDSGSESTVGSQPPINPSNNMLIQEKQLPTPGQTSPLPTDRRVSSIPKTSDHVPKHQRDDAEYWEYPSQQMFYNAMKRKGHSPSEADMSTIVGMHNAVNERTWGELLLWERQLHPETADHVRLKKFSGDATNISPKARLRSLFGSMLPFDRHDWVIVRGEGGEEARYIIDFYQAEAVGASPIAFHLDVRPAIDSVSSAIDRVRMSVRKLTGEAQRAAADATQSATAPATPTPNPLLRRPSRRWT
eukprot:m.367759 g.367759  ORF g.367759 m.367759 type:complete len:328 (+) comp16666_c0_seq1:141-1124(+)